jgi:hypothetical protein
MQQPLLQQGPHPVYVVVPNQSNAYYQLPPQQTGQPQQQQPQQPQHYYPQKPEASRPVVNEAEVCFNLSHM